MGAEGASLLFADQSLRPMDGAKLHVGTSAGIYIVIDFNRSISAILWFIYLLMKFLLRVKEMFYYVGHVKCY
jgi:hypothetical protein